MSMSEEKEIELTAKQRLFCQFYIGEANLNATKAAIRAGYSPKTARFMGCENLTKPNISAFIEKKLDEMAMTSKEVLAGLTVEAKGSISDVLEADGSFDYEAMCERGADKLIKELKITKTIRREHGSKDEIEEVKHEIKLYDAQAAKVHLGKAHGLFVDRNETELKASIEIKTIDDYNKEAEARVKAAEEAVKKRNE